MSQDVLRHPPRPTLHTLEERLRSDAEERELLTRKRDEVGIRVLCEISLAEATGVDPEQDAVVGRAPLPLLRRPGAREHVAALRTRDEVAVAIQRDDVRSRERERHDDRGRVRDRQVLGRELRVEVGEKLRGHVRRRRDDDTVGRVLLPVRELDAIAVVARAGREWPRGR